MLLAEQLLLLTIDPTGGLVGAGANASSRDAMARALLVELIVQGAVILESGKLRVVDPLPQPHRLLTQALRVIGDEALTPAATISRLRRRLWEVRGEFLDGFVRLGILHQLPGGLFGRFGRTRYALQSTQTRAELVSRLNRGAQTPSLDDLPALALALLAEFSGLAQHFLENETRLRLRRWAYAMRPSPTAIAGGAGAPRSRLAAMLAVLEV